MRCDQIIDMKIDALTGNLEVVDAQELARHLESCEACRREAEVLQGLWTDLGRLPTAVPDPSLNRRFSEAVARNHDGSPAGGRVPFGSTSGSAAASPRRGWNTFRVAASVALFLIGGLAGYFVAPGAVGDGRSDGTPATVQLSGPKGRFLILLYEKPGEAARYTAEQLPQIVAEYASWAGGLAEEGRLIAGEKLTDEAGRLLMRAADYSTTVVKGYAPGEQIVAGYFVVRAADYEEAVALAKTCPHMKYGSGIEVREIDDV